MRVVQVATHEKAQQLIDALKIRWNVPFQAYFTGTRWNVNVLPDTEEIAVDEITLMRERMQAFVDGFNIGRASR